MIAIIDYGSGNVGAIANIYKQLKVPHKITGDLHELESADRYILPGVGAFDATMSYLNKSGMVALLNEQIQVRKKKYWVFVWVCRFWRAPARRVFFLA